MTDGSGRDTSSWHHPFDAVIAVGSNIGDKVGNIEEAIARVDGLEEVSVFKTSPVYKTPPWGITDQDWFANACFSVRTPLSPQELLAACLETERRMGRVREQKWGPRVIDLDVLVYRDQVVNETDLTLPHPHMSARSFVLVPLRDVAPKLLVSGHSIDHWIAQVGRDGIERFEG